MGNQLYSYLEGQMLMIADATFLLLILTSGILYFHPKIRTFAWALFGLCWSIIIVAAATAQQIPIPITH